MRRFLSLLLTLLLLPGCAPAGPGDVSADAFPQNPPAQSRMPEPEPEPEPPEPVVARLMVAGDVMSHLPLTKDCYVAAEDAYSYAHVLEEAVPQLALADYVVANLETPLAEGEYSGFPRFNAPAALAFDLKEAGFDLLSTTNNHTLDQGTSGLVQTLDVLEEAGLAHVGTWRTREEREEHGIWVADVGGISVAFLAYTYGLNGFRLKEGMEYAASIYNTDYDTTISNPDWDQLAEDMAAARALETDLIAVIPHWGVEYQTRQNAHQEKLAQFWVGQGADLVLGSHSHVLQPCGMVTADGPDGQPRQGFVVYSLGNFISNQHFSSHAKDLATKTTVILDLELTKDSEGNTSLTDVRYTPYYMLHQDSKPVGERRHLINVNASIAAYEAGERTRISKTSYAELLAARDLCHEILGAEWDLASEEKTRPPSGGRVFLLSSTFSCPLRERKHEPNSCCYVGSLMNSCAQAKPL